MEVTDGKLRKDNICFIKEINSEGTNEIKNIKIKIEKNEQLKI
jgi:hypothetical protein